MAFVARKLNSGSGSGIVWRTMNAVLKTAIAMLIVIAGAVVIYETVNQDWYTSGLAMAWGAAISWARNLV